MRLPKTASFSNSTKVLGERASGIELARQWPSSADCLQCQRGGSTNLKWVQLEVGGGTQWMSFCLPGPSWQAVGTLGAGGGAGLLDAR